MICKLCKNKIPKNKSFFYIPYRSKTNKVLFVRWCKDCDTNKPYEVENLLKKHEVSFHYTK